MSANKPAFPNLAGGVYFLLGGLWGIGALVHPCPTCVAGTGGFFVRGAMEHVNGAKLWMNRTFSSIAE